MDMIRILAGETVTRANGDEVYWVHLIGDAAPSSLALTGADVEDMADDEHCVGDIDHFVVVDIPFHRRCHGVYRAEGP